MRFRAIDTFRGIAAILIILFHMKGYINVLMNHALIEKADIAVDFFFVLSGFVITYSSIQKINDWESFKLFVVKRFYRIYPLHVFTLILAVILETSRFVIDHFIVHLTQPVFVRNNWLSLIANITLTQSLNLFPQLTWNIPSWSISAEFYVYLVWGMSLLLFKKSLNLLMLVYSLIAFWFIFSHKGAIMYTYDYGFFRCLYGFFCGMVLYYIVKNKFYHLKSNTLIELTTLIFTVVLICNYIALYSWAIPIWFSFVIYIFSQESGLLSRLLSDRRIEFLGKLSYSYYLNHLFIISVFDIVFFKVIKLTHTTLNELIYIFICLGVVHLVSMYTYEYIEKRFQLKSVSKKMAFESVVKV